LWIGLKISTFKNNLTTIGNFTKTTPPCMFSLLV